MSSFKAELVADIRSFQELRADWNGLVENMEHPEIFYLWEWNFRYFHRFRDGDKLFVIVVRDASGMIAGIAPFCIERQTRLFRKVQVVKPIIVDIGDYQNILVHRACHRHGVVAAVFDYLRAASASWDVVDLSELCSRDPTTFHILNVAQLHLDWTVRILFLTAVALRNYGSARVAENRRQVAQVRNRLAELRRQGYTVHIGCSDFERLWPVFRELHRKAWTTGTFHERQGRLFFDDLRHDSGMGGRIEFSYIEFDGRPVAMHFGFVDRRKVYFYMPAMDRAFRKQRVGAALLYAMIEHYGKTHETFDFLRGLEGYKGWYTDDLDINLRLVISSSTSFAAFAYNAREATRRYAVDLGLPKGIVQIARSIRARYNRR
jgi:CelD/BcsL family acetyltransferase involved in cellulose biosynthesis